MLIFKPSTDLFRLDRLLLAPKLVNYTPLLHGEILPLNRFTFVDSPIAVEKCACHEVIDIPIDDLLLVLSPQIPLLFSFRYATLLNDCLRHSPERSLYLILDCRVYRDASRCLGLGLIILEACTLIQQPVVHEPRVAPKSVLSNVAL